MGKGMRDFGIIGLLVAAMVIVGPILGQASHEPFGVYEDWKTGFRRDRWRGFETFGGQEIRRELRGNKLAMRFRREGDTASNVGQRTSSHRLNFSDPVSLDQIEADFKVKSFTVTGCAANSTPSMVSAGGVSLTGFNDGSSIGAGDRTGNHFGLIRAQRFSNSSDGKGILRAIGFLIRCDDPSCDTTTTVSSIFLGTVKKKTFTLTIILDKDNDRFQFGLGTDPLVDIDYGFLGISDDAEAVLPFAHINIRNSAANCTAGPTEADAEIQVREVRTNISAIIP